ncbi:cytochrome c3 family protein [Vibrio alginolyticus]|uniref:cytochrome c3 family protein n=1 Tax=Vibrio alginolyticus TaxID=663 RepID=UPI003B9E12BA
MSVRVRCKECKKQFRANDKRTKICPKCKSKPKEEYVKNCTTCKDEFVTTSKKIKKCRDCSHDDFFKSSDFDKLYKAFVRTSYLEQFPDDTEGLIALLEYLRKLSVWRGFHSTFEEEVDLVETDYFFTSTDWEADLVEESSVVGAERRYKVGFYNDLDNAHLHPANGNKRTPTLFGRFVVENLIAMPLTVNRSMGNRHAYLMEGCTYDTRYCTRYEVGVNCESLRGVLTKHIQDQYDIHEIKLALKQMPKALDRSRYTKFIDYERKSERYSLLSIIKEEMERLLPSTKGEFQGLLSCLLSKVGELEEEVLSAMTDEELEDFEFDFSDSDDYHYLSSELTLPVYETIRAHLEESYEWS